LCSIDIDGIFVINAGEARREVIFYSHSDAPFYSYPSAMGAASPAYVKPSKCVAAASVVPNRLGLTGVSTGRCLVNSLSKYDTSVSLALQHHNMRVTTRSPVKRQQPAQHDAPLRGNKLWLHPSCNNCIPIQPVEEAVALDFVRAVATQSVLDFTGQHFGQKVTCWLIKLARESQLCRHDFLVHALSKTKARHHE